MQKKLALIILTALIVTILTISPLAKADTLLDSYTVNNAFGNVDRSHPSADTHMSAIAQSFKLGTTSYITNITLYYYKSGSPTGTVQMFIAGASGTYGVDNKPNATVYGASDTYDIASLPTSAAWINFTFSAPVTAYANIAYTFYITTVGALDNSNKVYVGVYSSDGHAGNNAYYYSSTWNLPGGDLDFKMYGSTSVIPTATPPPEEISYHKGRKYYICKDYDDGKSVFQWGSTEAAESTTGIKQKNKERLMDKAMQVNPHDYGLAFVIIAAIAGIAGGALIMTVAYPSVFPEMMKKAAPVAAKLVMLWH